MNDYKHLRLTLSLYLLLLLSFKVFIAAGSEPMTSNMEECKKSRKSFDERWPLLQTAVDRLINQTEGGVDNPSFTAQGYMSFYTTVYELCTDRLGDQNSKLLYVQYKKVFEKYIASTIDQEHAGEQIDRTLVNNTLAVYSEIGVSTGKNNAKHFAEKMIKENAAFYYDEASNWIASSSFKDNTPKQQKLHDSPTASSKKINLISSDGDVFEVDYDMALMSKTIEYATETNPVGDTYSIPVSLVSSKMLAKVTEYCKKQSGEHVSDVDLRDWDAEFVDVDHETLFDLLLSANYMNIKSLLDLTGNKIGDMMKGKTPEEIRQTFSIKDDFTPQEEDN